MLRPDLLCAFLLLCLVVPHIMRWAFRVQHTVTLKETMVNSAILMVCCLILWAGGTYSQLADVQILNGQITSKHTARVSCSHAYPCRCRPVSCGKNCMTTVCDTCYMHPYDVNWWAESTVGRFYIQRLSSQGKEEPPRWTSIQKGEPAARSDTYENYIKAAPDSIFHKLKYDLSKYNYPEYPKPHDYYRFNRVLGAVGGENAFAKQLNEYLNLDLRQLGSTKEVNIIVALTRHDSGFADALKVHWLGGKKNDVVVVIGTEPAGTIKWTRVFSWSDRDIFNVQLRDSLAKQPLDAKKVAHEITTNIIATYKRRSMEDYKYLLDDFDPPLWLVIMMLLVGIGGSIIATIMAHRNEYFYEGYYNRRYM